MGLRQQQARALYEDFRNEWRIIKQDRATRVRFWKVWLRSLRTWRNDSLVDRQERSFLAPKSSAAKEIKSLTSGTAGASKKEQTTSTDRTPDLKQDRCSELTGPTLGTASRLSLADQLRVLTIQFSLQDLSPVNVRAALEMQLRLLEGPTSFRQVLDEMIDEQRPRPGSPNDYVNLDQVGM
jgi:hypothetical protein